MRKIDVGRLDELIASLKALHAFLSQTLPGQHRDPPLVTEIETDIETLSWAAEDFLKFGKVKDFDAAAQTYLGLAKRLEGFDLAPLGKEQLEVFGKLVGEVVGAATEIVRILHPEHFSLL